MSDGLVQDMSHRDLDRGYAVMLPALCWTERRPDFYAVTEGFSTAGIKFRSAVVPTAGEHVSCSVRHLGLIETAVVSGLEKGFVVKPLAEARQNGAIIRTLLQLARQQEPSLKKQRVHPRIVPRRTGTVVTLPDGATISATIANVSASGAALRTARAIDVGTIITIGRTSATVTRSFADGFGAAFRVQFDPAKVDEHIVL